MRFKSAAAVLLAAGSVVGLGFVAGCEDSKSSPYGFDPNTLEFKDYTSNKVSEGEAPKWVVDSFHQEFPNAQITWIEQRKYFNSNKYYRVHFVTEPGQERTMDYVAPPARA